MNNTLVLDAACHPIRIVPWQEAITLFVLNKVGVVETYDRDIIVSRRRGDSFEASPFEYDGRRVKRPAVVQLLTFVGLGKLKPSLSRRNLFVRDKFGCQYCGERLSIKSGTLDHVLPKSRGGEWSWENLVVACEDCNTKKADRTPAEAGMKLRKKPVEPEWLPVIAVRWSQVSTVPQIWRDYLGRATLA